jgi:polyisoprenoid-binding protein YceI
MIMQAASGQTTAPLLQALLENADLAGEWVLDGGQSSVRLKNRSLGGLVPVTGVFREVSGNGSIGVDGTASGTVTVAAACIDTGNTRRDTHLRSADFFDVANHPDITFTATGVRPAGQGVLVAGTLSVRDRTRPLSFEAAAAVPAHGEIRLDAEVRINRADFGLTWNRLGLVAMNSTLTIHAVFSRR